MSTTESLLPDLLADVVIAPSALHIGGVRGVARPEVGIAIQDVHYKGVSTISCYPPLAPIQSSPAISYAESILQSFPDHHHYKSPPSPMVGSSFFEKQHTRTLQGLGAYTGSHTVDQVKGESLGGRRFIIAYSYLSGDRACIDPSKYAIFSSSEGERKRHTLSRVRD